jgi:phage N-6-adenine-methyltransferase
MTKYLKVHFLSQRGDWETPQELFDELDHEFGFDLDACATKENAKCDRFYSPEDDALTLDWPGVVWMNPPYGREVGLWTAKAYLESVKGSTVVCLLPARTDTRWFHDHCSKADQIRFIKGRLHFDGKGPAPFPSMIVIFRPEVENDVRD